MVKNLKRYRKQVERDQGKQEAQKYPLLHTHSETDTDRHIFLLNLQDAQLSQRDRAAGCVIVFNKSRRLEL